MLAFGIVTMGPAVAIGKDPLADPSRFHMLAGYLVFAVALGGMIGIGLLLDGERTWPLPPKNRVGRWKFAHSGGSNIETQDLADSSSSSRRDLY
jgi:hypothetical protein